MRIVLCWSDISGYMSACWRALSAMPGVEVTVIAFEPSQATFAKELMRGLNYRLMTKEQRDDEAYVLALIKECRPDVLYVAGWFHPPYRRAIFARELDSVLKWIGVDTPWTGSLRQQIGRLVLPRLIRRLDRVYVAGERAWQYMRRLRTPEQKLCRGLYGIDYDAFAKVYQQRLQQPGGWPRRFLYVGRYAPEKAIPVLVEGYHRYRAKVADPWPLTCCGSGPLKHLLAGHAGIEDRGFVAPPDLPAVMAAHGAFVIASVFEPWGVVVAEAAAAGLPVICTEAVSASVELVRSYFNGMTVASGDADALARGMRWLHENWDQLPEMGRRGRELAAAYSAQMWAIRWASGLPGGAGDVQSIKAGAP